MHRDLTRPHVTLEAKLAFLRQPDSYAGCAQQVEAIETHMSWVFLTDGHLMLDHALRHASAGPADIRRVAARLARFYRDACRCCSIRPPTARASCARSSSTCAN